MREQYKRFVIHVCVSAQLVVLGAWALPRTALIDRMIIAPSRPYVETMGLWQGWSMFAPNPTSVCSHVEAAVIYADGSEARWVIPRPSQQSLVERYFKERYRKWSTDHLRMDDERALWPDAARYAARHMQRPGTSPVEVRLWRYWTEITVPPGQQMLPLEHHHTHDQGFEFYRYTVRPADLVLAP